MLQIPVQKCYNSLKKVITAVGWEEREILTVTVAQMTDEMYQKNIEGDVLLEFKAASNLIDHRLVLDKFF